MTFDPITQDAPTDSDYPATMFGIEIDSSGAALNGVIFTAAGEGLHPTMLLLHGFPGHERNLDLAHIFRRAGWNVVIFHYRGAWGSGGDYRFSHVLEDVKAAVNHFQQPQVAHSYRSDPQKVIVVGHSLGGWASLMTAAHGVVEHACSISGVNMGYWGNMLQEAPEIVRPSVHQLYSENLGPLSGVTADDLMEETEANAKIWDVTMHVEQLQKCNLLLVAGKRDELVTAFDHHIPLVKALEAAQAPQLGHTLLASDHGFSDSRIELARTILNWLTTITF